MRKRQTDIVASVALCLCVMLGYGVLYRFHSEAFFSSTIYNTYTRQALAWRQGLLHLPENVPYLELAVFEGEYYVSFPPVPSVVLWILTFLFGEQTPDGLLIKLYAVLGAWGLFVYLRRRSLSVASACFWAVFCTFGGCMWAITQTGAVWYMAQVMAFALMSLSLGCLGMGSPSGCLVLYALAVGCRPFDALYGPVLLWLLWGEKKSVKALIPGTLMGLCIAFAYGWYNYARFGNIFEFGHNYLPEFSTEGGKQFALEHVANNLRTFVAGLPFGKDWEDKWYIQQFGFSMFIANPVFILLMVWLFADCILRRMTWRKAAVMAAAVLHLFLLLLHRTFGGYQFGARYTCDLLPWAALYLGMGRRKKNVHWYEILLFILAMAFAVWGGTQFCV